MLKTDEYHALEQYQVGFAIIFKNISVLMVITSTVAFEQ